MLNERIDFGWLIAGHVQQGNEQPQISHEAKRRQVQANKQSQVKKFGGATRPIKKLGRERQQASVITRSDVRLNICNVLDAPQVT